MDKSKYDTLWKIEHNSTTTVRPTSDIVEDFHYDYEYDMPAEEGNSTHPIGWESDDVVEDPTSLDYMTWPKFLQGKAEALLPNFPAVSTATTGS
jgi:hypothetical protein